MLSIEKQRRLAERVGAAKYANFNVGTYVSTETFHPHPLLNAQLYDGTTPNTAELHGPAVAALGSLAGGMAAKALGADKGKGPTNGGGIPGLTSSKGQGKDGTGPGYATQVDPTTAINYFKQAAEAQSSGYNEGLSYYGTAIDQAKNYIQQGYTDANNTLKPLSLASGQALNQQLRMLGLDPIQATVGFGDSLRTGYNAVASTLPAGSEFVKTVADQMDAAVNIKDPQERADALARIKNSITNGGQGLVSSVQSQLNNLQAPKSVTTFQAPYYEGGPVNPNFMYNGRNFQGDEQGAYAAYQQDLDAYNSQKASLQSQLDSTNKYVSGLQDFGNNFAQNYGTEFDRGYTPEEITNVVSNLPGYQFNLDQGTKAIERQGAAKGMLGSGNTLSALQTYGQGQAQSYYNQYMGYLSGITAQGAPATAQISANQSAEGTALATLAQNYGAAQMSTAQANANFLAKTLQDSGTLFNQTAMFNAQAQNASILQGNQIQAGLQQQAIQSGPSYMNAQTSMGQLNLAQQIQGYTQNQNQQYANGFLGRGGLV
jgi:hypothetical protein